jgi:hypothetical protein
MHNTQSRTVSITFPEETFAKIEETRGDVSRSRYILRLLEKSLESEGSAK